MVLRSAITAIILTTLTPARRMGITARTGSITASSLALARGTAGAGGMDGATAAGAIVEATDIAAASTAGRVTSVAIAVDTLAAHGRATVVELGLADMPAEPADLAAVAHVASAVVDSTAEAAASMVVVAADAVNPHISS